MVTTRCHHYYDPPFGSLVYQAQFPQNQAKAEISVYRQFAWVNCVKYKRNQGVHLRGDTGRLIQLKIPF